MKEKLENLWLRYFSEECAWVETEEEKNLAKRALELHNKANEHPTRENLEKHIEALCELQSFQTKKAFFKGCEFAAMFLIGIGAFGEK